VEIKEIGLEGEKVSEGLARLVPMECIEPGEFAELEEALFSREESLRCCWNASGGDARVRSFDVESCPSAKLGIRSITKHRGVFIICTSLCNKKQKKKKSGLQIKF